MKRGKSKTRWNLIVILIIGCALTYASYKYFFPQTRPQSASIFVVTNSTPLTYGNTQLAGRLQKDAPVGKPGSFVLITSSGQAVKLDIQGLDKLLGSTILVKGVLSPATTASVTPTMRVSEVTVQ